MKTKPSFRVSARIILIILILAMAAMACVGGGGGGGDGGEVQETPSAETQAADVTATYGAEEFHAQLTAIAQPETGEQP